MQIRHVPGNEIIYNRLNRVLRILGFLLNRELLSCGLSRENYNTVYYQEDYVEGWRFLLLR